jgi:hypothetical protein
MSLRAVFFLLVIGVVIFCARAQAQTTYTGTTIADAFLATGSPDNPVGTDLTNENFGAAGTLAVSPASADKGQYQSVLEFNFANAIALFNTAYGSNDWIVTGITLTLTSNYGTNGVQPNNRIFNVISAGNFVIEWLSDTNWVEGTGTPALPTMDGVTFGDLPELLSGPCAILCTNTYTPPGNNVPVTYTLPLDTNLVAEVVSGVNSTLLFYAADNQIGYLFNSHEYGRGDEPLINVTAAPFMEIVSCNFTNGVFSLTALGQPNAQYQIQANSDLTAANWQTLGTVTAGTNGIIQFADTTATNQRCFYRLSQMQ